ncbi:MAG TPA: hypothetical protein DCZ91_16015 [Lachnospiraceae bacterium]|nr:hypothetical protein [Lachnospiraceae bacterium]
MLFIHLFALLGILLFAIAYMGTILNRKLPKYCFFILFLAAFSLRLLAAALSKGFDNDTACFAAWADRIYQVRPGAFYSPDVFTDYPPGYMYVLWLLGWIRNLFRLEYYSFAHLMLLKLPAILCDMACSVLLFRTAAKKLSETKAFFLCLAYLFNPAVILNSSVWGQVDSILALITALMCLYLAQGRMYGAYIVFGLGILVKPHTLLFTPVLLAGFLDHVLFKDFRGKSPAKSPAALRVHNLAHNCIQILTVIIAMIILCLPFGLENVWKQYFSTVTSYPYAAVNACNFWGMLGLNWISQDNTFLGIPYRIYGWTAIAAAVAGVLILSLRNRKRQEKYPFLGALMIFSVYLFSVRMHERYLFPGLLLLILAYVLRPSRLLFLCYAGFSVMHFYNAANVLFFYDPSNYDRHAPVILFVSAGMLACWIFLFHAARQLYGKKAVYNEEEMAGDTALLSSLSAAVGKAGLAPRPSRKEIPLKKADFICMAVITSVYTCFALYDLGDRQAPVTAYDMTQGQSVEFEFSSASPVSLSYYIAPWHDRKFTLEGKITPSDDWTSFGEITLNNVFTWQTVSVDTGMPYLRLTLEDDQASLLEFVFLDGEGNVLMPSLASAYGNLFDESDVYPEVSTYRNSMYFDEIYHGRTAYEFIHGLTSYENTHPPLGKILIALGVAIFGMNPFGWRIVGTLFGIAMVPMVYLFARKISGDTLASSFACVLFAFDFMHFTQTRIATIDVYITFFVILMYYFMYRYSQMSFYDTELKRTLIPLGACGVCMGLGIASKWTGVYAGCGLAVIFFAVLYRRYREYVYACKEPSGSTEGISHKSIQRLFAPCTKNTILFCLVFFVAVPAVIYLLSYIPFRDYSDRGLISRLFYNQNTMFSYHSGLESTHDFSSPWYEWPTIKRPIWYYSRIVTQTATGGLREGISAFGNPAVWWAGIPASFYMVYLWLKKKDRTAAFLITGYMAQYLPWFFVTRITFIYHYFPSVVFIVLMITYGFSQWKKCRTRTAVMVLYCAAVIGLFLLFYPVLSGAPVDAAFVEKYLRWFPGWVLTAK